MTNATRRAEIRRAASCPSTKLSPRRRAFGRQTRGAKAGRAGWRDATIGARRCRGQRAQAQLAARGRTPLRQDRVEVQHCPPSRAV
eukprot:2586807-Pleurochrysis_carterae.AAC.1